MLIVTVLTMGTVLVNKLQKRKLSPLELLTLLRIIHLPSGRAVA